MKNLKSNISPSVIVTLAGVAAIAFVIHTAIIHNYNGRISAGVEWLRGVELILEGRDSDSN
jgi:hypothetical protein